MRISGKGHSSIIALIAALAGCQSVPLIPAREVQIDRIVEVKTIVKVPCIEKMPDPPVLASDDILASAADGPLMLLLYKDRTELMKDSTNLRAMLEACVKPQPEP